MYKFDPENVDRCLFGLGVAWEILCCVCGTTHQSLYATVTSAMNEKHSSLYAVIIVSVFCAFQNIQMKKVNTRKKQRLQKLKYKDGAHRILHF